MMDILNKIGDIGQYQFEYKNYKSIKYNYNGKYILISLIKYK